MSPATLVKVSDLNTAEPFNRLFPIGKSVLAGIVCDMRRNGYDAAHPVIAWKGTLIDGHTRLEAARLAGLSGIPVIERDFADEDQALIFAIACQRNRRNLTDADIDRLVSELHERQERGGDRTSEKAKASSEAIAPAGKSAEATAKLIGTSRSKVEKVLAVQAKAAPEVKAAVKSGAMTINKAYQTTRKTKAPKLTVERVEEMLEIVPLVAPVASSGERSPKSKAPTLRSLWMESTKLEREAFLRWVDSERTKDLPKGDLRELQRLIPRIRRFLNQRPDQRRFVKCDLGFAETTGAAEVEP